MFQIREYFIAKVAQEISHWPLGLSCPQGQGWSIVSGMMEPQPRGGRKADRLGWARGRVRSEASPHMATPRAPPFPCPRKVGIQKNKTPLSEDGSDVPSTWKCAQEP